jgi:F-type H+-transporting ATPase subunit delta
VDVAQRQHLVDKLLGGALSSAALDLTHEAAGRDWPSSEAMAHGVRDVAVQLAWRVAIDDDSVEVVRWQLFTMIGALTTNLEVGIAVGDANRDAALRRKLALALVKGAGPVTELLVRSAIGDSRGAFAANLSAYLDCLARLRGHRRAAVTTAVAMTSPQVNSLITQLSRIYGAPIDLEPTVDPKIIGGVRVSVGDDIIDGSIKSRLDAAREAMHEITTAEVAEKDGNKDA